MMKITYWLLLCCLPSFTLISQTPATLSSSDILLGLKKLQVLGSVLYVAAHPDDENTRLLAYFSKEKLYRTGYLSMTRGDGGQNLIGNEQGIELGLIRTQELLAARRIDGAEQFFTSAYDFGFCKTTEEALQTWNKNKVLSDAVWVIRKFQPDIIITRFPQDNRAGHGHHSASAVLAVEAAKAAADPTQFPEQLTQVKIWKAHRVLWNSFNFGGGTNTTSADQFKMDVGVFNPILGKGYGEIAAESRSQHKSQGFGVPRQRGQVLEYFATWQGDAPVKDLMDGLDLSWGRIRNGAAIQRKMDTIINAYSLFTPGKSVKDLVELYKMMAALEDNYWKKTKMKEVLQLIEACSGLYMEATVNDALAVQTDSIKVNFFLNNRNGNAIQLKRVVLDKFDSSFNMALESNKNISFTKPVYIDASKQLTQPYWLRQEMKEGHFEVNDQQLIGKPDNDASSDAVFTLNIEGQDFEISKPLRQKFTDPVKGELYQPQVAIPPVTITPAQNLLLSNSTAPQNYRVTVKALKTIIKPEIKITPPKGWETVSVKYSIPDTLRKDQEMDVDVLIKPMLIDRVNGKLPAMAAVKVGGEWYSTLLKTIKYDHIPDINYFRQPVTNILTLDLKTTGKRIGFIEGAGDFMPAALRLMGYEVILLNDNDLANGNLAQYDAIITGVRAYNTKSSLNTYYPKLMKYIENGGNLIVQYNTSNQIGPIKAKIGPYPFDITRTRVTDEKAKVTVLKPEHPLMNYPNKLNDADFDSWIQERSIYHATKWDEKYETIFSINDAGEKADEGSLVMAKYGKGSFVYTGMVFFRQLPAGVPGAYRLLANIIALNKKKGF
jgi:LmbE family N-acetylglucosaminyl deacetylase